MEHKITRHQAEELFDQAINSECRPQKTENGWFIKIGLTENRSLFLRYDSVQKETAFYLEESEGGSTETGEIEK